MPHSPASRGDRTRTRVLAAARTRFAEHGFEDTTLADVAADAGVSGPTVAFHFGSKLGLLTAVASEYYADLVEHLDEVLHAAPSATERLVSFARAWLHALDGDVALFGVMAAHGWLRETASPTGQVVREGNARITRRFERLVGDLRGGDPSATALPTWLVRDAFFGGAEHVLRARAGAGPPRDLDVAADALASLVLRCSGIEAPGLPPSARLAAIEGKLDELLRRRDSAT